MSTDDALRTRSWSEGTWLHEPEHVAQDGEHLLVTAAHGSDLWRTTSYGFVRDSAPALLAPLEDGAAVEVDVLVELPGLYDQAGLLLRVDEATWTKTGVETSDGAPQLGAVVTRGVSDWSLAPVPEWAGTVVTLRASRSGDAVTLRARTAGGPWRMVRLFPLDPGARLDAGPYCAAPDSARLTVRFCGWRTGPADADLHDPQPG